MNTWLVITWMFMAGWVPQQSFGMGKEWKADKYLFEQHNNVTKVEFDINACLWDHWDIYGNMENFQTFVGFSQSGLNFSPYSIKYTVGTEVYLLPKSTSNLNVSIYAKHECQHPLDVWAGSVGETCTFNSSYTDIGIKVQGTLSF